jgi:hypothetical protein
MAYLEPDTAQQAEETAGDRLAVDIRGSAEPAHMTGLPFYHRPR